MSVDPLMARILAAPGDRSLRQVYADALQERGDLRGAFISHQVALADLDSLDPRFGPLLAASLRLEQAHSTAWQAEVAETLGEGLNPVFREGFVHRVTLEAAELDELWPWLAAREPVAGVELNVYEALPPGLRSCAAARDFRVVRIVPEHWVTTSSVGQLLAWGLPKLEDLDLSGCDLGNQGPELLASLETDLAETFDDYVDPPPFSRGQLKRLMLHGCKLGDEGARTLVAAKHLDGLRELDLGLCGLTEAKTLEALAAASGLQKLERLSLTGNKLAGVFKALAGWKTLSSLAALSLPQVVTAEDLRALFPKPSKALRELDLRSAKQLLETPEVVANAAQHFTSLDLGTTSVGDDGWKTLLTAKSASTLLHLHANGCSLSDAAVTTLVESRLDRLVTLDLSSNKLTDAGLTTLANWAGLATVANLRLGNNRKVTEKGLTALMQAKQFVPARLEVGKLGDAKCFAKLQERFGATCVSRG